MAHIILLDSGPLFLATGGPHDPGAVKYQIQFSHLQTAGYWLLVPEIADYEVRREILRRGATARLRHLDRFKVSLGFRRISESAMLLAAEFWALVRSAGLPTAPDPGLDGDTILAGMAATEGGLGDTVLVATDNVRHLRRFPGIDARQLHLIPATS